MITHQDYHQIQVLQSDGQDTGPGYWPNPGENETAKLAKKAGKDVSDKAPRAKPQMLRLAEDDPRFIEWRIKLGILLKQEIAPNPQEGLAWYVEFPRGYWLYEKSKHLWVSGYPAKSKLFKSPQEFGVHLIWLISGSKDSQDCCCVHCNPPKVTPAVEDLTIAETIPTAAPAVPSKAIKSSTAKPVKAPQTSTSTPTIAPSTTGEPTPTPVLVPSTSAAPVPAPFPAQAKATEQTIANVPTPRPSDPPAAEPLLLPYGAQASPVFFRVGELVWFQVVPSWRIGLIARADYQIRQYEILPISHSAFNQNQLQSKTETALRPFLAFTVPPVSHAELLGKSFDSIPWDTYVQRLAGEVSKREALLLDASKLAATKISQSFSLFTHLQDSEGGLKSNYQGAFLGAERIEISDALRVRITPDQQLGAEWQDAFLGLREVCTASTLPGVVFFKGDLLAPLSGDDATPPGATIVPAEKLPAALREEAAFRLHVSTASQWRIILLRQNAVLREDDIRGRFYPSNRLLPVLAHPNIQTLQQELAQGVVRESGRQLNQRMDTLKDGYIGMKRTRMDMVGEAIPHGSGALFAHDNAIRESAEGDTLMAA